jgi:hypothetical protein
VTAARSDKYSHVLTSSTSFWKNVLPWAIALLDVSTVHFWCHKHYWWAHFRQVRCTQKHRRLTWWKNGELHCWVYNKANNKSQIVKLKSRACVLLNWVGLCCTRFTRMKDWVQETVVYLVWSWSECFVWRAIASPSTRKHIRSISVYSPFFQVLELGSKLESIDFWS